MLRWRLYTAASRDLDAVDLSPFRSFRNDTQQQSPWFWIHHGDARRLPRSLSRPIHRMSGRDRRDFGGVFRRRIAAPDHVHVGPQQNQIVAVNIAGDAIGYVEHGHRRAVRTDGAFEPVYVRLGAAES